MALLIYGSNLLEALSEQLHKNFKEEHKDVFQPDYIITQTEGMKNWLMIELAGKAGIAANIKFLSPNELIIKVAQIVGGANFSSLSSNTLVWIIFSILKEDDFVKNYPVYADYYRNEDNSDIKRIALAEKLADLFDQYQIYRPDFIESWNLESTPGGEYAWQQYIWKRIKEICGQYYKDRTQQGKFILEALKDATQKEILLKELPNIHLFGISITTPYHLDILMALGEIINIKFYLLNPAPLVYWQDNVSEKHSIYLSRLKNVNEDELIIGNSLLTGWGKIIRDTYFLLFRNEDMFNNYSDIALEEPGLDSLLHTVQQDIYYNLHGTDASNDMHRNIISKEILKDGSISINSCYTIAREVEVLYNYLVHLIDVKKEGLSARDIVVMVSDIDSYAPYIKAVFQNAKYKFKFTIADESFNSGDNILSALESLLIFTSNDFKGESIMSLLESSLIKNRFSLNNLQLIRNVIEDANIRFGITGSKEDDTIYLSWKYGIQKMIYNICIKGEEYEFEDENYFLADIVEGNDANEIISFLYFVNKLISIVEERERARPLADWVKYIEDIIEKFLLNPATPATDDYEILLNQIAGFNALQKFAKEPIEYEVFSRIFLKHLSAETRNSSFANGGITFCSLIPMRSIPFKVVALMGLNFDKFPRKDSALSFNLINEKKRKGDRNTKDNDKHLFLETLLSAKKYLYISYIGQSVSDNAKFPPSILLDELIDYIDEGLDKSSDLKLSAAKELIIQHPLHSFSNKYGNEENLYNYLQLNPEKELDILGESRENKNHSKEIKLDDFILFFKNPFKFYYNKVLDVRYNNDNDLIPETEVFSLNNLEQWQLKNELLKRFENNGENIETEWIKKGIFPLKNVGTITYNEMVENVRPVWETFRKVSDGKAEELVQINVGIGEYNIAGTLKPVYDDKLILVNFSKDIKSKHFLDAYLKYLIGCAAQKIKSLVIIDKNGETFNITELTQTEAISRLSSILEIYLKGQKEIIPFDADWFKIDKIPDLDNKNFNSGIDKIIKNEMFACDQFLLMEYEAGFFEDESVFENYKDCSKLLLNPLEQMFLKTELQN